MKQESSRSRKGKRKQKPLQNNFQCTHSHGSRYCYKYAKECDSVCMDSSTCFHCVNNHIPMHQYPCSRCAGLERNED